MEQLKFNASEHLKEDIKSLLEVNCDIEQTMIFVNPFSDSELQEEELQLSRTTQELFEIKEELKNISQPLKDKIKEVKKRQKEISELINHGGYETEGKTYAFIDSVENNTQIFTQEGRLLESRALTRKERQHQLKF